MNIQKETPSSFKSKTKLVIVLLAVVVSLSSFILLQKSKPTIFMIGDSLMKNGRGDGSNGQWGWGDFMAAHFDTTKISIKNNALSGTSSRTFQSNGLWEKVLANIKPGDFVVIQFGHNDPGEEFRRPEDSLARGTIKGNGNETREYDNPVTKKHETVYTYGWYIRKYITDTKAKGATPIVVSLTSKSNWKDGKVIRANTNYGLWAAEAAKQEKAYFIDMNKIIADKYDKEREATVTATYFAADKLHTVLAGAKMNAAAFAEGLKANKKIKLSKFLIK